MEKIKFCRTCALADPRNQVCQMNRRKIELDKDFCSKHVESSQLVECAYCGQLFIPPGLIESLDDGSFIEFCYECQEKFGTCAMCDKIAPCRLQDPNYKPHIPMAIMKRFQQGNMMIQKQVINPDRVEEICIAECECWDGEGCARQDFGCCTKYNQKTVN